MLRRTGVQRHGGQSVSAILDDAELACPGRRQCDTTHREQGAAPVVGLAWLHALRVAPQVPKGQSVRFQAHSMDFLDLAASMGPKFLLESAMRNYSGLVKGETILVAFGGDKYAWWCGAGVATAVLWLTLASCVAVCRHYLDIADVEPEDMVTLFGNLDLEVTISPPKGMVCATTPCHADTIAWG